MEIESMCGSGSTSDPESRGSKEQSTTTDFQQQTNDQFEHFTTADLREKTNQFEQSTSTDLQQKTNDEFEQSTTTNFAPRTNDELESLCSMDYGMPFLNEPLDLSTTTRNKKTAANKNTEAKMTSVS